MNLTVQLTRSTSLSAVQTRPAEQPFRLTRTFVETGDERCPIAGIWSRIDCEPIADEPELTRPAVRRLLPWRAFHTLLTIPRYSLA
jgi:hypothetical protein